MASSVGPSIWFKFLIPWYCVTLPSAVYFMVVRAMEWRQSKRILIFILSLFSAYSVVLFWMKLIHSYTWFNHGPSYSYLMTKDDNTLDGSDLFEIVGLHLAALGPLVGLYILYVFVAAWSRKIFRRHGNQGTPCISTVQQIQGGAV